MNKYLIKDLGESFWIHTKSNNVSLRIDTSELDVSNCDVSQIDVSKLLLQNFDIDSSSDLFDNISIPTMILIATILKIPTEEDEIEIPIPVQQCHIIYCHEIDYSYKQYICTYPNILYDIHFVENGTYTSSNNLISINDIFDSVFLIVYLDTDDIVTSIEINDKEYTFFTIEWYNKQLFVVSFMVNEFGEYVNDLDDLYEMIMNNALNNTLLEYIKYIHINTLPTLSCKNINYTCTFVCDF